MIIALSRFKVANGLEDKVREAFLSRPGLVDSVPGFLGLETFTDSEDSALFYLVTRWTGEAAFRNWHSGSGHAQSHLGIPKGLKLDPSFTLLRVLDRIGDQDNVSHADEMRDSAPVISAFLEHSSSVFWLKAGLDGAIVALNQAAEEKLGGTPDRLRGASLWLLLTQPDVALLRAEVGSGVRDTASRHRLNFLSLDQIPFTLECHLDVRPDGFVLIGESAERHELGLQRELMSLNNQLAVQLRENDREAKALQIAHAELKRASDELQDSHWHLKKMQEVLPVCTLCGKIDAGDLKWVPVVEYLRRSDLILSHGLCPDCLDRELDKLKQPE